MSSSGWTANIVYRGSEIPELNGKYVFGVLREFPMVEGQFSDVPLGDIGPGKHWLFVVREDHGGPTGAWMEVTAQPVNN